MVLLAGGAAAAAGAAAGAAAYKVSQPDVQRIEEHTGVPAEELTEEELVEAMRQLGIQKIELTDEDQAAIAAQPAGAPVPVAPPAAAEPEESYLDELERLAGLRDQGIITDAEFEAKKQQLLGI
jgi:hypothetical protein